jgi:di/tricarboxylate transporter
VVLDLLLVPAAADPEKKRPPDTWSIEATSYAVWIVSRWITSAMPVPILSFLVAQAAAVSVTNGSITS